MAGKGDNGSGFSFDWDALNTANPVIGLRVYSNGFCEVVRDGRKAPLPPRKEDGQEIKEFSHKSRQALARTIHATRSTFLSMMTLTCPAKFSNNGADFKDAQNRFFTWLRYHHPCEYLWFFEFQKRGAPHTHVLLSIPHQGRAAHEKFAVAWVNALKIDPNQVEYDPDKKYDYFLRERCKHFHYRSKQWENIRDKDGAKKYALQYAMKTYQKRVPKAFRKVGRFWACSRSVSKSVQSLGTIEMDDDTLKAYLSYTGHSSAKMPYTPKNLYGVTDCAQFLPETAQTA
jgi:hypothetical protein